MWVCISVFGYVVVLAVTILSYKVYVMNSENSYNYEFYSKLGDLPYLTPVILLHALYNYGSHVSVLVCMHKCIWLCSSVSGNHISI